ncbi:MAG: transcriptional repressor [Bacteroidales bacterium]|nr:transcriptional repressor [Bacteroidales bacterium]
MKITQKETYETVHQLFTDYLVKKGHRKTPERYTILKEIYATDGHFDIESLYIRMKKNKYRVSRATLYNTIEILLDAALVIRHQFGSSSSQYEKAYKARQHDHVICMKNGEVSQILEFCDPRIQEIQSDVERLLGVEISGHSLTFFGKKIVK